MRQIVFDLETTGFRFDEGHRIVEIGGVELVRGALTGRTFHTYVNPERDMPEGAFKVHGLSQEFLRPFPIFSDTRVSKAFIDFVGDAELVAHNGVAFDLPFINAELAHAGMAVLANAIVDTLHLARRKFPGSPASLDALCARFGIDTRQREKDGHGALLDARLLAEVYIELTGGLQAGLDFAPEVQRKEAVIEKAQAGARERRSPLASLISEDEAAAHRAFVERELGPQSLWRVTRPQD
jgi:DNA polymerase-3 subunit epsilon